MYFVEEIAHMYSKKLQNTWQTLKKPSKEAIKCPSKKLEEFLRNLPWGNAIFLPAVSTIWHFPILELGYYTIVCSKF